MSSWWASSRKNGVFRGLVAQEQGLALADARSGDTYLIAAASLGAEDSAAGSWASSG